MRQSDLTRLLVILMVAAVLPTVLWGASIVLGRRERLMASGIVALVGVVLGAIELCVWTFAWRAWESPFWPTNPETIYLWAILVFLSWGTTACCVKALRTFAKV